VHAVNWQEREIQDLFGLKTHRHPNPRRCALHDDWPELFPLRQDFDLHTHLTPFIGERHKFRHGRRRGACSKFRSGRCMRASLSRDIFFSALRESQSYICKSGFSTRTKDRKSFLRTSL